MIYIDPPYNTGNDFIYPDNYSENLETYLKYTGQVGEEGLKSSTNQESDGRFHSKWLNMMWPRLYLARNLLREDGAIFVSIDDHESANLKMVMDEIFGEENFVAQVVWERAFSPVNLKHHFSESHDYVLCYAKDSSKLGSFALKRSDDANDRYKNPDNDPRGSWGSGIELGLAVQFVPGQAPEHRLVLVQVLPALVQVHSQTVVDFRVEILEELFPGVFHGRGDLRVHFPLQPGEFFLDLGRRPAILVDRDDALLEFDARLDGPEDFVARAENS